MSPPDQQTRASGLVLMGVVALWSGGLTAGLAWAVLTASARLGPTRSVVFTVLASLLLLLSTRTAYELLLRLRHRQ